MSSEWPSGMSMASVPAVFAIREGQLDLAASAVGCTKGAVGHSECASSCGVVDVSFVVFEDSRLRSRPDGYVVWRRNGLFQRVDCACIWCAATTGPVVSSVFWNIVRIDMYEITLYCSDHDLINVDGVRKVGIRERERLGMLVYPTPGH